MIVVTLLKDKLILKNLTNKLTGGTIITLLSLLKRREHFQN